MGYSKTEELSTYVQQQIITSNEDVITFSRRNNCTIYGAAADALERNTVALDEFAENIAAHFAAMRALQITREYEESRGFVEKWIKNNELNVTQMQAKRDLETSIVNGTVQGLIKGTFFATKKGLSVLENRKIKAEIWDFLHSFAAELTDNKITIFPAVDAVLRNYYSQLFSKKAGEDLIYHNNPRSTSSLVGIDEVQAENIALLLYQLYAQKHLTSYYAEEKTHDLESLAKEYISLGFFGSSALEMIGKFEAINAAGGFEFGRTNTALQGLYHNLSISIPHIDASRAKMINREFSKYVPNGDKQRVTGMIAKGAITAAATAGGIALENPFLLKIAAGSATSLFSDLSETEIIGNCLVASGISETDVKTCILDAQRKQKELPPVL